MTLQRLSLPWQDAKQSGQKKKCLEVTSFLYVSSRMFPGVICIFWWEGLIVVLASNSWSFCLYPPSTRLQMSAMVLTTASFNKGDHVKMTWEGCQTPWLASSAISVRGSDAQPCPVPPWVLGIWFHSMHSQMLNQCSSRYSLYNNTLASDFITYMMLMIAHSSGGWET